jgi:inner membrane protein
MNVDGALTPENRKRSIYNVLTYRSNVNVNGNFHTQLPKDIDAGSIQWNDAKLCVGISDFKGIEEKITVIFNGTGYDLTPGLPTKEIDSSGLSVSIPLDASSLVAKKNFSFNVKLKGSQQLQFLPLSANSKFALRSSWANPSFDGNVIPNKREVNDKGFVAQWQFNQANLPFSTVVKEGSLKASPLAFGVSMVQPADQYAKTMRSVKYAILFIGLTFALFFIVELMQHKPFHPVQYVLVGLALVIFYTLLLSISEFIAFDLAYLVAATATILLITFYAKAHFQNGKVAAVFAAVLSSLYAFIFVLIRLEDTALLVGSIGLFIVLALVMYASRKINWYRPSVKPQSI